MIYIDEEMKKVYPDIRLACLEYDVHVQEENEKVWDAIHERIPFLLKQMEETGLTNMEGIKSSRTAYKAFGRNPGRYRVSSESLLRRIRQGKELYHVNSVVDTNNLISIQTACSLGSYDLDHIHGDIILSVGKAGQGYEGIGKDFIDMENMIVLKDEEGIFGSPTSDSHRAMISLDSHHIVTILYCFSNQIDLVSELEKAKSAFCDLAGAENIKVYICE